MGSQAGSQASFSAAAQTPEDQSVFVRPRRLLEEAIRAEAHTADGLAKVLGRLQGHDDGQHLLPCVSRAIELLIGTGPPTPAGSASDSRVEDLLAAIYRWALEGLAGEGASAFPKEVTPWAAGSGAQKVVYTAAQCRALLANALLMNVRDTTRDFKRINGGLNFEELLRSTRPIAAQKIACLLQYFETARALEGTEDDAREVIVERTAWPGEEMDDDLGEFCHRAMDEGSAKCCDSTCLLHDAGMEQVEDADAFVNFANPNFGYGCFIASCTQEEILQVCCPEFNVGMLHVGYMTGKEVVKVYGVRRFSRYIGYRDNFQFAGVWTAKPVVQTILTMDATTHLHFAEDRVLRDIRKAYLCFRECRVISTGRWGCGAFGGQPAHKFAQQLVAASLAGCSLRFSTFGAPDRCDEVLSAVVAAQPSAGDLLRAVLVASAAVSARTVTDFTTGLLLEMKKLTPAGAGQFKTETPTHLGSGVSLEELV